jgi:hypothetical protein
MLRGVKGGWAGGRERVEGKGELQVSYLPRWGVVVGAGRGWSGCKPGKMRVRTRVVGGARREGNLWQ